MVMIATVAMIALGVPLVLAQIPITEDPVGFGGTNGRVNDVHVIGDQLWIGGDFTEIYDADTNFVDFRANVSVLSLIHI